VVIAVDEDLLEATGGDTHAGLVRTRVSIIDRRVLRVAAQETTSVSWSAISQKS
jgi:hypothetical protein